MKVNPTIIGTGNAREMLQIGLKILSSGGSALDAVEATVRAVEDNPFDTSVGLGGLPNILGDIELDASIMDGKRLQAGAVAAVRHFKNPISIARKVMEETPHVFLVGEGAERFAESMGFEKFDLSTERSQKIYRAFVEDAIPELNTDFVRYKRHLTDYINNFRLKEWYERLSEEHHGTVNIIAMDSEGNICTGVSTSGVALKFPGRVSDSAIIGAGNYADNRAGGAACGGRGELVIRLALARSVITHMRSGMEVAETCVQAIEDINALEETGGISCLAMDNKGKTYAASNSGTPSYYYMDLDSDDPEKRKGSMVSIG